jgi:hypothetical protein
MARIWILGFIPKNNVSESGYGTESASASGSIFIGQVPIMTFSYTGNRKLYIFETTVFVNMILKFEKIFFIFSLLSYRFVSINDQNPDLDSIKNNLQLVKKTLAKYLS